MSQARQSKRLPAAQRRLQLLQTASKLFSELGYARTTTAQLAQAAGVTEPIIYRHFASKRDLFVALVEQTGQRTLEIWNESLARAKNPADRLEILLGKNPMVALGDEEANAYRVILQSITETDDDVIHKAVDEHFHAMHAFLVEEVEAAQKAGEVRERFSAEMIAWMLIDMALGYGVLQAMGVSNTNRAGKSGSLPQIIAEILLPRRSRTPESE
ncbi:MAG: TetR/AcrR family transcriptional regulator [Phycisphaerales bacterium]|nr:TetR/AcrR family transcriptional regulator [Phycisphaerales bacterium]MCB9837393.1 TetR/AcrR family transcriptional regulator [Phycisphaera sp.]